jgi:hypothetical protein
VSSGTAFGFQKGQIYSTAHSQTSTAHGSRSKNQGGGAASPASAASGSRVGSEAAAKRLDTNAPAGHV